MKNGKKKVGIVTLMGYYNYGNRLQNYAVEQIMQKWGYIPVTLKYDENNFEEMFYQKLKNILRYIATLLPGIYGNRSRRFFNFKVFNDNFLHIEEVENLSEINKQYCAFFVGSDQVWNPNEINDFYFLKFAEKKKRFSIAASFGLNSVPESMRKFYTEGIQNMQGITVREQRGQEIIENLTGRKEEVIIDPVMYFPSAKWEEIMQKPRKYPSEKYIVYYFLGKPTEYEEKLIDKLLIEKKLAKVDLYNKSSNFYECGPREFLYYLKNAEYILTDSFHACAFSIIFKKNFWVFERHDTENDMFSRIYTLCCKFGLKNRIINNFVKNLEEPIEYGGIDDIIKKEAKKIDTYLKKIQDNM